MRSDFGRSVKHFHKSTCWGRGGGAVASVSSVAKSYPRFDLVELGIVPECGELGRCLSARRSERAFREEEITDGQIGAFVYFFQTRSGSEGKLLRVVPSAGGLVSSEVYLIWRRNGEHRLGHVGPVPRVLESMWSVSRSSVEESFRSESWVVNAAMIIVVTGRLGPALRRYGSRGYRFVLLEAGASAMVATLVALDEGLGSCMVGGFSDAALMKLLDLSSEEGEVPLVAVAVGWPESGG